MTRVGACFLVAVASACWTGAAHAQFNGHNSLGDFGLLSGSQPDPGLYASVFYYRFGTDMVRDRNGDVVSFSTGERGSIVVNSFAGILSYVSDKKILGANYGAMAVVPVANIRLAVPILGLEQRTGTALGDVYVQPINLGWHTKRVDFTAGLGLFAPTGRYKVDAEDNVGLGMWSFELYGGATVFFDAKKSWHLATTAWYETHTEMQNSDVRVGDLLSLEGGFGKSFLEGTLNVGAAYYAQWKISNDDFGAGSQLPDGGLIGKHRVFALGPEVTLPLATSSKLIALVNARYLWEFGARTKTEGNSLVITATFPIPSVPIN